MRPEDTKTVAVASLDQKGANNFFFSLHITVRGGDSMYVTWELLFLLIGVIIALLTYIDNHNKKK